MVSAISCSGKFHMLIIVFPLICFKYVAFLMSVSFWSCSMGNSTRGELEWPSLDYIYFYISAIPSFFSPFQLDLISPCTDLFLTTLILHHASDHIILWIFSVPTISCTASPEPCFADLIQLCSVQVPLKGEHFKILCISPILGLPDASLVPSATPELGKCNLSCTKGLHMLFR